MVRSSPELRERIPLRSGDGRYAYLPVCGPLPILVYMNFRPIRFFHLGPAATTLLLLGCGGGGMTAGNSNEASPTEAPAHAALPMPALRPVPGGPLVVVCDDRSGSMVEHQPLTKANYAKLAALLDGPGGGVLAVRAVGDPAQVDFIRLELQARYLPLPALPDDPKLSELALHRRQNAYIGHLNDSIASVNKARTMAFMEKVERDVIAYAPKGKDITDVQEALRHVRDLLQEPAFAQCQRLVLVASDGVDDAHKGPWEFDLRAPAGTEVFVTHWNSPNRLTGPAPRTLESVDGFLHYLEQDAAKHR